MENDKEKEKSREERRRRIVERGSDRIALITGRTQSLPSSQASLSPPSHGEHHETDQVKEGDGGAAGLPKYENVIGNPGKSSEIHEDDDTRGLVLDKRIQRPTRYSKPHSKPRSQPTFFSSKRLNLCIVESEITRALCALAIAVLVVISNTGGDVGSSSGGFVSSRPLYILLLTDATIVMVRMHLDLQRSLAEATEEEEEAKSPQDDSQTWDGAVKVLERGLVAYQTFRGVFIDCSVYMVTVICGLCLV